jgi:outer membrane immunogenic protein
MVIAALAGHGPVRSFVNNVARLPHSAVSALQEQPQCTHYIESKALLKAALRPDTLPLLTNLLRNGNVMLQPYSRLGITHFQVRCRRISPPHSGTDERRDRFSPRTAWGAHGKEASVCGLRSKDMTATLKFARPAAAAIGLLALVGTIPAYAADAIQTEEPPAPAPVADLPVASWAGPYAGLNAGYGFSGRVKDDFGNSIRTDGFVGGAFAGYNWQQENFVYGVEGDIGYNGTRGSDLGVTAKGGLEGSLRARLGYSMTPDILLYGTAGGAAKHQKLEDATSSDSNNMLGWTAGVGTDIKVTDNVFARVEYRYTDFGHDDFTLDSGAGRAKSTDNRVTFGVGMKF